MRLQRLLWTWRVYYTTNLGNMLTVLIHKLKTTWQNNNNNNNNNNNIYSNYLQNKRFKTRKKTYRNVQDNMMQATQDERMG